MAGTGNTPLGDPRAALLLPGGGGAVGASQGPPPPANGPPRERVSVLPPGADPGPGPHLLFGPPLQNRWAGVRKPTRGQVRRERRRKHAEDRQAQKLPPSGASAVARQPGQSGGSQSPAAKARSGAAPGPKPRPPRKRPEAVLVRVAPSASYLETYRSLLSQGREVLQGVVGVKMTRLGHVLLELEKKASARDLAASLRVKLGDAAPVCSPLLDRMALEIRGIDPPVEGPELLADLGAALKVDPVALKLKMLRLDRQGTQTAVAEVPTNAIKATTDGLRFRSGLTVVRCRVLPKLNRCFLCHQLGHLAKACQTVREGEELCRRCEVSAAPDC